MGDEYAFIEEVQAILSERYPDKIGDVFIADALMEAQALPMILENLIVMWGGEDLAILIVNDENGFSDEDLLNALKDGEAAGVVMGVDHVIDGAPESTFVYDASDVAGCVGILMENALR